MGEVRTLLRSSKYTRTVVVTMTPVLRPTSLAVMKMCDRCVSPRQRRTGLRGCPVSAHDVPYVLTALQDQIQGRGQGDLDGKRGPWGVGIHLLGSRGLVLERGQCLGHRLRRWLDQFRDAPLAEVFRGRGDRRRRGLCGTA